MDRTRYQRPHLPALLLALLFSTGVRADGSPPRSPFGRVVALFDKGGYAEAIELLERARGKAPKEQLPAILFNLGQCHARLGHEKEAHRYFQEYLDRWPRAPNADALRGRVPRVSALVAATGGGEREGGSGGTGEDGKRTNKIVAAVLSGFGLAGGGAVAGVLSWLSVTPAGDPLRSDLGLIPRK